MNSAALASAQIVLADNDKGRGSPIGLFVVLVLCVAVYFLYKSLNRHIKRVPESFDPPAEPSGEVSDQAAADATGAGGAAPVAPDPAGLGADPAAPRGGSTGGADRDPGSTTI
jgi:hypothetical protein